MRTTMKRPVAARVLSGAALVLTLTACSSGSGSGETEDSGGREGTAASAIAGHRLQRPAWMPTRPMNGAEARKMAFAPVLPSFRNFLRTTHRRAVAATVAAPRDRRRR